MTVFRFPCGNFDIIFGAVPNQHSCVATLQAPRNTLYSMIRWSWSLDTKTRCCAFKSGLFRHFVARGWLAFVTSLRLWVGMLVFFGVLYLGYDDGTQA